MMLATEKGFPKASLERLIWDAPVQSPCKRRRERGGNKQEKKRKKANGNDIREKQPPGLVKPNVCRKIDPSYSMPRGETV